jgi:hypothetical protein
MLKPKSVETGTKVPDTCILKMGKGNNGIQWREEMYNIATEEFGEVGTYFYTNVAHQYPYPHEREYNPFYVEPAAEAGAEDEDAEEDDDNENDVDEDIGEVVGQPVEAPVPVPILPMATQLALINKL